MKKERIIYFTKKKILSFNIKKLIYYIEYPRQNKCKEPKEPKEPKELKEPKEHKRY